MRKRTGERVPFILFLKSFEVLLYEIMSWIIFYPRTLWRSARHPVEMMKRGERELQLPADEQFRDVVSPPIFLLVTVVAANAFEVAIVGHNPLSDKGIGLAAMIQDNTSLILFRLIAFASVPVVTGAFALVAMRRPVDRDTLQPLFYGQCFATTPIVLMCSLAETLTRLPQPEANIPAALLFGAAGAFYIGAEGVWYTKESGRSTAFGILWAIGSFVASAFAMATAVLLFSGF
jgi:hypothetical protein